MVGCDDLRGEEARIGGVRVTEEKKELLTISSGEAEQPFKWSVGVYGSKFLKELRDNKKILGIKCPKCGRVYIPPRRVCGRCFVEMKEWVELSDKGTVENFTVVYFSFLDPATGKERPVPYGYGHIKLDGADSAIEHFIEETDIKKIRIGMRVQAVFEEKRQGTPLDIKCFRTIEEGGEGG